MPNYEMIEMQGVVTELLPNTMFKVRLTNDKTITARLSGKLRINNIHIILGDSVTVEISPYDVTTGRIVWRNK